MGPQVKLHYLTAPIFIDHTNFLLYTVYSGLWNEKGGISHADDSGL